jgi:hypothetical protein
VLERECQVGLDDGREVDGPDHGAVTAEVDDLALVDTSLLLVALRDWQVYQLSGIGRALPALAGLVTIGAVAGT